MSADFYDQYKHPEWQKVRARKLEAADYQCTVCGDRETTLHVHHKQYFKDYKVWEYEDRELQVLCEHCHTGAHVGIDAMKLLLARTDEMYLASFMAGRVWDAIPEDEALMESAFKVCPLNFSAGLVGGMMARQLTFEQVQLVAAFVRDLAAKPRKGYEERAA